MDHDTGAEEDRGGGAGSPGDANADVFPLEGITQGDDVARNVAFMHIIDDLQNTQGGLRSVHPAPYPVPAGRPPGCRR